MLLAEHGIVVVGEAAGGAEAVRLIVRLTPEVVLMGFNAPVTSALETMRRIARVSPGSQVLALSASPTAYEVSETRLAGACGHLRKDASIEEIVRRVRAAALRARVAGADQSAPQSASGLRLRADDAVSERAREPLAATRVDLTRRELEILRLVATGRSNADIAEQLVISALTVKNHVSHILAKLHTTNRTAAAAYAARAGLIRR
jgi:DNA-binding NarL/FixJ family response regulator